MRREAVLGALRARLHPARWGAIPLFLLLAALVRVSLGEAVIRTGPRMLALLLAFMAGFYLLAPLPWQWTGDGAPRAGLGRGAAQALLWNAGWITALLAAFALARLAWPMPAVPPAVRVFMERSSLPREVLFGALTLPLAFLAGWFLAEKEAAELERGEALAAKASSDAEAGEARGAARRATAAALQAQLDPHVLYNALGGLSELVREDPARAEAALETLADLYRRITALGAKAAVPLRDERALLEDQLALETLRLGPRLAVDWDWPEALGGVLVPPLLVQPLVENAVKHGIAPRPGGGALRLAAAMEGGRLRITVANTGLPPDPARPDGTGLANLKARLALLEGARLELRREGPWTVAELRLELP
jgi:hypothetical protein